MREITQAIIVLTVAGWAAWDVSVLLLAGPPATISCVVWDWTRQNSIIAFAAGLVCGHLFWPR